MYNFAIVALLGLATYKTVDFVLSLLGMELPTAIKTFVTLGAGVLAMAKPNEAGAPNNGSQFFITTTDEPTFDGKYTVFGKVVDGLDVLKQLQPRDPQAQQDPPPGDRIQSIDIQSS